MSSLPIIHMFWYGPHLSRLERLCIASFIANGHPVHLHVYEEPTGVPPGTTLRDANQTIPSGQLFVHAKTSSIAAFADWFRFQVLYNEGGIWADTDVVCLRPLDYGNQTEIFAWEDERTINVAVLGLPAKHELSEWMLSCWRQPNRFLPYDDLRSRWRKCWRRLRPGNSRARIKWGEFGPSGFTSAAAHLGYARLAMPFWYFYPIHFRNWRSIFDESLRDNQQYTSQSYALHLWNEMTRRAPGFDKNATFPPNSLFERLCARYQVS
jgi:hypothetical protein